MAAQCAVAAALALGSVDGSWAQQADAAAAVQSYAIAAGPLESVLAQFLAQSGVLLSSAPALTQERHSGGLQGSYSAESALAVILQDTGLIAQRQADGSFVLRQLPQALPNTRDDGAEVLPEVVVTSAGAGPTTEGSGSYGSAVLSTFKGTQTLRHTPQPVTVVTQQVMQDQGVANLEEVLTTLAPGVTINYTDSERISYYARGHQIDSMQVDGMGSYQAGSSMLQADTAMFDRVEVVRGANGLMRGSGNPSATVNMVRKMPTRQFQAQVSGTIGSWDKRRGEADISGPLNESGSLRGRIVAAAENKRLFQRVRKDNRRLLYGVVEADLTPSTVVSAGAAYSLQNATGAWGGLPAAPDGSQLGLPRETYLGAAWNEWNRDKREIFASLEHYFANDWTLKMTASHVDSRLKNFRQTYFTQNPANPYAGSMEASIYRGAGVEQTGFSAIANGPFELLGRRHELVLGVDLDKVRDNGFGYGWWGMSRVDVDDIRTWNPYTDIPFPQPTGEPTAYDHSFTRQQGVYATARLSVTDPLTAIVGARMSWWNYQLPADSTRDYSVSREVTPYLGVVYDIAEDWSVYASYSEIFKPQREFNGAGSILEPVRGENYEVGMKGELLDGRLQASLSAFRINNVGKAVDDVATPDPCLPHYTGGYCKIAGGKTRSEGWEAEVQGQLAANWNISGGYTNTRTRYLRDSTAANVGRPLRSLDPRHILRLYSSYRFTDGALRRLTVGAGVQVQSDKYATARGVTYRQGGYALYNAMVRYAFSDDVSLQLNVYNLFDKVYYKQVGSGVNNYYGDPRNWKLTLHARF